MVAISVIILIVSALLALIVLAQNPKGGGLAAGFTGAQQIGGVQRTADFLEKSTWTLATALMVLCLVSAGIQGSETGFDELDQPIELPPTEQQVDPSQIIPEEAAPADAPPADAPPAGEPS